MVFVLALAGVIATFVLRLGLNVGIAGWATNVVGILLIIMLQTLMLTVLFCFGILGGRQGTSFIPRRDYSYFTGSVRILYDAGRRRRSWLGDGERIGGRR